MKAAIHTMLAFVMVIGLVGCGKTLGELRTDGDAIIDNGTAAVGQTVGVVSTIIKKVIAAGFAVYDIGKKIVDDSKDNVGTVVSTMTGADQTPAAPATK